MAVWGALIGAGINYLASDKGGGSGSGSPAAMADPWAQYRPQYMSQLAGLMSGTVDVTKDPGYQTRLQQGSGNLERQMAARGGMGSGAEKAALVGYGQDLASQEYQSQFDRLSKLAGVSQSDPAAAAGLQYKQNVAQAQGAGILGQTAWNALSPYFRGSTPAPSYTASPNYSMPSGYTTDPYGFAVTPGGESLSY